MPKVSVIVPAYNIAPYIERCVQSLCEQTLESIEIIVVDDGSTDGTQGLCKSLASHDSRIKVITQENQGVSAARNAGIKAARGKYIGFVDGDDFVRPNMYESMLDNSIKHDADVVWVMPTLTDTISSREYIISSR